VKKRVRLRLNQTEKHDDGNEHQDDRQVVATKLRASEASGIHYSYHYGARGTVSRDGKRPIRSERELAARATEGRGHVVARECQPRREVPVFVLVRLLTSGAGAEASVLVVAVFLKLALAVGVLASRFGEIRPDHVPFV
jgi:hypothetical protein